MKAVDFPESNTTFGSGQDCYFDLHGHLVRDRNYTEGRAIFCWRLSLRERLRLLFVDDRIWHSVLTFNKPLQPQLLELRKPSMAKAASYER